MVPRSQNSARRYGLVGAGRVARHFKHYFSTLGLPVLMWSRDGLPGDPADLAVRAAAALSGCDVIWILIRDEAIAPWAKALRPHFPASTVFVHASGALRLPKVYGWHPLMSFGSGNFYDTDLYRRVSFIGSEQGPSFSELFPELPNPCYRLPDADRALYHALCVIAGNFSVILWQKLFRELESRWQIPAAAAEPYLTRVTENLREELAPPNGVPSRALTGPLARRDWTTIDRNLEALRGDTFAGVYRAFLATQGLGEPAPLGPTHRPGVPT